MQQVADKMNFQDPVQKYAECHSWDMNNSNATKYHEIKVGKVDNTCFKENVPTFEILVGWILRLGLNFWVINVTLYGWKCDPAYLHSQPYEQISIQKRVAVLKKTPRHKMLSLLYGLIKSRMAIYSKHHTYLCEWFT